MSNPLDPIRYKVKRYGNLVRLISNWPAYLLWKMGAAEGRFPFEVRGLGRVDAGGRELGPFRENFFNDVYLSALPAEVRTSLGEAPVVLDVGGNVGHFALAIFRRYPAAEIVSVEPHPYCHGVLEARREAFARYNWRVDPRALDGHAGELTLHTNGVDEYSSTSGVIPSAQKVATVTVACQTLAQALERHGLQRVDLAKFDCEGGEYGAIYGASPEVLQRLRVLCIETHRSQEPDHNQAALNAYLLAQGYRTNLFESPRETELLVAWRSR